MLPLQTHGNARQVINVLSIITEYAQRTQGVYAISVVNGHNKKSVILFYWDNVLKHIVV